MKKVSYADPRERFIRVAEKRTSAVLERLRILSNCANTQLYSYNEGEVKKIFRVIEEEMREAKSRFRLQTKSKKAAFKL
jgi:hypothetical protein